MLATMAHKDWLRISSDKSARGGRVGPTQGKAGPLAADKLCKPFSNLGKLETWSIPASPPAAAMGSSGLVMDFPPDFGGNATGVRALSTNHLPCHSTKCPDNFIRLRLQAPLLQKNIRRVPRSAVQSRPYVWSVLSITPPSND